MFGLFSDYGKKCIPAANHDTVLAAVDGQTEHMKMRTYSSVSEIVSFFFVQQEQFSQMFYSFSSSVFPFSLPFSVPFVCRLSGKRAVLPERSNWSAPAEFRQDIHTISD